MVFKNNVKVKANIYKLIGKINKFFCIKNDFFFRFNVFVLWFDNFMSLYNEFLFSIHFSFHAFPHWNCPSCSDIFMLLWTYNYHIMFTNFLSLWESTINCSNIIFNFLFYVLWCNRILSILLPFLPRNSHV